MQANNILCVATYLSRGKKKFGRIFIEFFLYPIYVSPEHTSEAYEYSCKDIKTGPFRDAIRNARINIVEISSKLKFNFIFKVVFAFLHSYRKEIQGVKAGVRESIKDTDNVKRSFQMGFQIFWKLKNKYHQS